MTIPGPIERDDSAWGPLRSRLVEWYDPVITAAAVPSMSGLAFLEAIRDGALPPPPIASMLGFEMHELSAGKAVFSCTPDESAYNPIGVVHGGLVCTLADTVAACAVQTTLPAGMAYTSIDLTVSYLRPVTLGSGRLTATGLVTKPGRRVAYSRAEIVDAAGKVVATATSSCLVTSDP